MMPNYLAHTVINISAGAAAAYVLKTQNLIDMNSLVLSGVAFTFSTLFLSPDLDLNYSNPARNWGPLRILWWPYSLFFKHRGLSHSILFSSFTRLSYFALILCLCTYGFYSATSWASGVHLNQALIDSASYTQNSILSHFSWRHHYSKELIIILIAIFSADIFHILADKSFSAAKAFIRA
jgi:uncharacterized metal-binding protein